MAVTQEPRLRLIDPDRDVAGGVPGLDLHQAKQVVVVDDEPLMCELLDTIIRSGTRYHVETFVDPRKALERVKSGPVNVVITDITMPELSGTDLLREVKCVNPDIEVIMLTGNRSYESALGALQFRAFEYLEKPVDASRIVFVLENAMSRQELSAELTRTIEEVSTLNSDLKKRMRHQILVESPNQRMAGAATAVEFLRSALTPVLTQLEHSGASPADPDTAARAAGRVEEVLQKLAEICGARRRNLRRTDLVSLVRDLTQQIAASFPQVTLDLILPESSFMRDLDPDRLRSALAVILARIFEGMREKGLLRVTLRKDLDGLELSLGAASARLAPGFRDHPGGLLGADPLEAVHAFDWKIAQQALREAGGSMALAPSGPTGPVLVIRIPGETSREERHAPGRI